MIRIINHGAIAIKTKHNWKRLKKDFFEIDNIETYLNLEKFVVNFDNDKSDKILLILSTQNLGYKIYKGEDYYKNKIDALLSIFNETLFCIKKKEGDFVEYFALFNKDKFNLLEDKLYEVCVLFRFSSLLGIKRNTEIKEIEKSIYRFSFYGIHSYKKWRRISDWNLFFDGEHLSGHLIS
ncbi:hypothetical protein D1816_01385 [Aquimarina sp. AD10]|uniref:hypothetical protein n=1 Tax=Aquimarina sp. AD10 TaxID=1714849 RepID=UPI000E542BAB|nr:hypothetical protein [Aquimarina sp. AD10]AXT59057.1 hypothetical protein D1816_01385 [Aquimarina sp. AD10]RKM93390.1 hypothetical protein D7033_19840 [Aquimarina sp. AD10]